MLIRVKEQEEILKLAGKVRCKAISTRVVTVRDLIPIDDGIDR